MAGVTDRPFRQLCKQLGAGYAVSEMAASDPRLWASEKTSRRINHDGEMAPRAVQIAGADPQMLANCARFNVERGAQIIDINMGCPVKKVCNSWCGSALLQDENDRCKCHWLQTNPATSSIYAVFSRAVAKHAVIVTLAQDSISTTCTGRSRHIARRSGASVGCQHAYRADHGNASVSTSAKYDSNTARRQLQDLRNEAQTRSRLFVQRSVILREVDTLSSAVNVALADNREGQSRSQEIELCCI